MLKNPTEMTDREIKIALEQRVSNSRVLGTSRSNLERIAELQAELKRRNSTSVIQMAQAISRVLEDVQEDVQGLTGGLFIDPYEQSTDERRVTEIGAELKTTAMPSGDVSEFTVTTSTGQTFLVSVRQA